MSKIYKHILVLADGRSPTTKSWLNSLFSLDFRVSLISSFPCTKMDGLEHFEVIPIAFSRFASGESEGKTHVVSRSGKRSGLKKYIRHFSSLFTILRYWLGPISLVWNVKVYKTAIAVYKPDLVHALRIPFEGMLGSYTPKDIPFVVSTWGNDLTLHAKGSPCMRLFTRRCLKRADGLTSDTQRDINLASEWGFDIENPTLNVPGSSGLNIEMILNGTGAKFNDEKWRIPEGKLWAINPRGFRPHSVHNDVFFAAIPLVLQKHPEVIFVCPNFAESQAEAWLEKFQIRHATFLLPKLTQEQLWSLYKQCALFVSPSSHDGTPNTLLEAMACGCFPVAGDIESLREWIQSGENGLLINPRDPQALADAINLAIESPDLRLNAARINQNLMYEKASLKTNQPRIQDFYNSLM
ncbi:MAG: glycosyltransferase family 4 protein [Anaerolineaceae bacterium]|nr:glycosyltransferase family 4 protein [Anaerolineaceae bacterium]